MKKTLKICALALLLVTLISLLASCGGPSGTYSSELLLTKTTYTFSGKEFTVTVGATIGELDASTTQSGTFEMGKDDDGNKTITFTQTKDDTTTSVTYSYSEGEEDGVKYIKIDGTRYDKE